MPIDVAPAWQRTSPPAPASGSCEAPPGRRAAAMHFEHVLGDIEPNHASLFHGCSLSLVAVYPEPVWHTDAGWGPSTHHPERSEGSCRRPASPSRATAMATQDSSSAVTWASMKAASSGLPRDCRRDGPRPTGFRPACRAQMRQLGAIVVGLEIEVGRRRHQQHLGLDAGERHLEIAADRGRWPRCRRSARSRAGPAGRACRGARSPPPRSAPGNPRGW